MDYKILLFLLFNFLFLGFVFSANISSCMDLNSDFEGSNVLIQDLNDWDGTCLTLVSDLTNFELDCQNHFIDTNVYGAVGDQTFFDVNNFDLNSLVLKNCNLIYNAPNIYDDSGLVLNINSDVNYVFVNDSNFTLTRSTLFYFQTDVQELNIDLLNTNFNPAISFNNIIRINNSNINELNISNVQEKFDFSTYFLQIFNSDLNYVNFENINLEGYLDLNYGQIVTVANVTDDFIDFNFFNSDINVSGYGYGFWFSNVDYNRVIISDINNLYIFPTANGLYLNGTIDNLDFFNSNVFANYMFIQADGSNSNIDFNFYNSNLDVKSSNYISDYNSVTITDLNLFCSDGFSITIYNNINYFNIFDSNIYCEGITSFFLMSYDNLNINLDLNNTNISLLDSYYFLNAYDVNSIEVNNLDLFYQGVSEYSGFSNYHLDLFNSNIDINKGALFYFQYDTEFYDINFFNSIVTLYDEALGFTFPYGDPSNSIELFNIYDMNLNFNSSSSFITSAYGLDVNKLKFTNSNLVFGDNNIFFDYDNTQNNVVFEFEDTNVNYLIFKDINFLNNYQSNFFSISGNSLISEIYFNSGSIYLNDANLIYLNTLSENILFDFGLTSLNLENSNAFYIKDSVFNDLNIINLNLQIDSNVFSLFNSKINNFYLEDSILDIYSLFDLDVSSVINNGLIYNNKFILNSELFGYAPINALNLDFNVSKTINAEKRAIILDDDSSYIGGNYWVDSLGNSLCDLDLDEDGVCDTAYEIFANNSSFIDYLPLTEARYISGCRAITTDYLGVNLKLTQDINGWNDSCFSLTADAVNNYFQLDCQNHTIDTNTDSSRLFYANYDINRITFKNCNFNTSNNFDFSTYNDVNYIEVFDSNLIKGASGLLFYASGIDDYSGITFDFSGSYVFLEDNVGFKSENTSYSSVSVNNLYLDANHGGGAYEIFGFQNVSELNVFDSNITIQGGYILELSNANLPTIDMNFYNSFFDLNGYASGFGFSNLDVNSLNIYNLNLAKNSYYHNTINISSSDINYIYLENSDLNINNSLLYFYNIDSNYLNIRVSDLDFNAKFLTILDSNISSLDLVDFNMYSYNCVYNISGISNINLINTINSQINQLNDYVFCITYFDSNVIDINFINTNIIANESGSVFEFYSAKANEINIFNLDSNFNSSGNFVYLRDSNIINLNLLNSTINLADGSLIYSQYNDYNSIFFDFNNSLINISNDAYFNYFYMIQYDNYILSNLNISDYDSSQPLFVSQETYGPKYIEILDSNIFGLTNIIDYSTIVGEVTDLRFYFRNFVSDNLRFKGLRANLFNYDNNKSFITLDNASLDGLYFTSFFDYDQNTGIFLELKNNENLDLDLNFGSTNLDVDANKVFYLNNVSGELNLINSNISSDKNLFFIFDSNIALYLNRNILTIPSLLSLDVDSNVTSGLIYNNKFVDTNKLDPFIFANPNAFNASFNTNLTQNKTLRSLILNDDSSYVGGNLWLNNSTNFCSSDSSDPRGICDSIIPIYGSLENYIDNYGLIRYASTTSGTDGPGGPTVQTYDLSSNLSLSSTTLSKVSNIILTPNISKSGTATFGSAEYKIYFYNDSNTKVELFSDSFSDSSLPLTNTHTLTLDNLLSYGDILDLVNAEGKLKLYLEVISSNDNVYTNNISQKIIYLKYLEANIVNLYLNDFEVNGDLNQNLENSFDFRFNINYIAIDSDKDVVINFRTNKRLVYVKQIDVSSLIGFDSFEDSVVLTSLDFLSDSNANLIGNLELSIYSQDYSNKSTIKYNINFYKDYFNTEDLGSVGNSNNNVSGNTDYESKYYLKYKSKLGVDENQTIYLFDDKNNFLSNVELELIYNNEVLLLKTDDSGITTYTPKNIGTYFLDASKFGLKGSFDVLDNYKSTENDYVILEGEVVLGEVVDSNVIYYLIPTTSILLLIVVAFIIFYFKRKPKDYDFTLSDNYLKSEFFEKEQLEKDIKLAKSEESVLEHKVIKNELKFAYKEDKVLEKKLKEKTGYDL